MASIIQMQRRAIEVVFSKFDLKIAQEHVFFLKDDKIDLLGISNGVGTCSDPDFHGIDIAVFSREFPFNPQVHHRLKSPVRCQGAVILRNPNQKEIEELKRGKFYLNQSRLAVEGLELVSNGENQFCFKSNGKSITYVELV